MERTYVVKTRYGNEFLFDSVGRKGSNRNYEDARSKLAKHLGMNGRYAEITDIHLADKYERTWIQY